MSHPARSMTQEQSDVRKVETCSTVEELDLLREHWSAQQKQMTNEVFRAISATRARLSKPSHKRR